MKRFSSRIGFFRSLPLLAAALFFANGCSAAENFQPVADAPAAPTWKLTDLDGRPLAAAAFKGKVLVVDFWATWCGPCLSEIPGYIELQKKLGAEGFTIVGLSLDEIPASELKKFVEKRGINYPVALAGAEQVAAFGDFKCIPATFVIDREGKLRFQKIGAAPIEELEKIAKSLL
jgi:thiol-disulfide isomerase/thioredoxin